MIVAMHNADGKKIISIIDGGIIGKRFNENGIQLDLTADFYKGDEKNADEIEGLLRDVYIVHAVGKESVDFLCGLGLVDETNIMFVQEIPHAEVLIMYE
jgi:hypothetical protein